ERLAVAHREKDGLTVEVVTPEAIYNEFSSGTPDATAYRRLMKMFYDRSSSLGNPPKYLLLFGDGIYDNRGISGEV
ncbi:C25 family cysteine peptidase, partial [Parabacteroides merdae]